MITTKTKIQIFISYSHDDETHFKIFNNYLSKAVKNSNEFEWQIWNDKNIHIGTYWDEEIQSNILKCDIAILLVSIGFMSSEYIKEIEFKSFIDRYAEKNILIFPVYFKPSNFNEWKELAEIQFFKPNGLSYGKENIEDFTFSDLIKFNESNGIPIPNQNIDRYVLDFINSAEKAYKLFLTSKNNQLFEYEIEISELNKLSDYPKPGKLFTGREKEIANFKNSIIENRILVVEGLGGNGKTSFVSKCIEELSIDENKIIWLNGTSQSRFDTFIENSGHGKILIGKDKTDQALYSSFKDNLEKEARIVFLDNFSDIEDKRFIEFLSFSFPYLKKATIVLITKVHPNINGVTSLQSINLDGLGDDALDFALKLKNSQEAYKHITETELSTICSTVNGHPLAIEFALLLMSYGRNANEILLNFSESLKVSKGEEFSRRLFYDIFEHKKTTNEEREVLMKCSVYKGYFNISAISHINDNAEKFNVLSSLIDKKLITHSNKLFTLHPLVRILSYEKLENKKQVHKTASEYFIKQRTERFQIEVEELIFYHLNLASEWDQILVWILANGKNIISKGYLNFITEIVDTLISNNTENPTLYLFYGEIAQLKTDWASALKYFEFVINISKEQNIILEGKIKQAEILFRRGDTDLALPCFEDIYLNAKKTNNKALEARALNDIGLVYTEFDNLDKAYNYITSAIKIRTELNDIEGLSNSLNNLANIYLTQNKYEKAAIKYKECLDIADKNNDIIGSAIYSLNIAPVLIKLNRVEEALNYTKRSLLLNRRIGDNASIAFCYEILAKVNFELKKNNTGFKYLSDSLIIRKELNDKRGMASCFNSLGTYYFNNNNIENAIENFLKSYDYYIQISNKRELLKTKDWIVILAKKHENLFIKLFNNLFPHMSDATQLVTTSSIFLNNSNFNNSKMKRNENCFCGSGKKFKKCHGN